MPPLRFNPLHDLLRIIYPDVCIHCGEPLVGDERHLCTRCMAQIPWTHSASACENEVELRLAGRIPYVAGAALLLFRRGNIAQSIVHQIKYHSNLALAKQYGHLLGAELLASGRFNDIDCLVPVPLHRRRKRQRGYNQSELLCDAMAENMHVPVVTGNLYRRRYTDTQTRKNRLARMDNMKEVFAIRHPERFENKHILLVDDIITTGATTENCYHALRHIPGLSISIAALAVTSS